VSAREQILKGNRNISSIVSLITKWKIDSQRIGCGYDDTGLTDIVEVYRLTHVNIDYPNVIRASTNRH